VRGSVTISGMRLPLVSLTGLWLLAGCIATEPFPPPPEEVLVAVNRDARTLTVVPTGATNLETTILLGASSDVPAGIDARAGVALVPLGEDDAVAVVDLDAGTVIDTYGLPAGSGATGAAIVNDSIAYIANPWLNSITRLNYLTGDTASVTVGVAPWELVFTRGRIFVLNANVDGTLSPNGSSWLTVIDPVTNAKAAGIDSIPLLGPGFARSAAVGADGLLYVMSAGDSGTGEGRLSIVNPVTRVEVASFGGFGNLPAGIAAGHDRLYIASRSGGMRVFDTRTRVILRGAGDPVAVAQNTDVAVDASGRIYAIQSGPCIGGALGRAFVFNPSTLASTDQFGLGDCASGALITTIPVAP
jgi:hypothetical protein